VAGSHLYQATWRKSSRSGGNNGTGGDCVEVAALPDAQIAVRDSKNPAQQPILFTAAAMRTFITSLRG
jgi:hypothetical protein